MSLEKIQQDFVAAIFNADRETALQHVTSDENLDAAQRLGIYRGSVHGILTQALSDFYPVSKALLGDEFFDKMCDRYIDQNPPTSPFFSHYGDQLALFLNSFEPVQSIPFISDVANFEWTRHTLWQQTMPDVFDFSKISELDEQQQESLIFKLKKTVRLIQSDFRIDQIWFAHQTDSDIAIEEIEIDQALKILMWKSDDSIKITDLSSDNSDIEFWTFLSAVDAKTKVSNLAENFGQQFPELLNRGIQDGWIESFTCD